MIPGRTATYEGAGALLWWDLLDGTHGAEVWDERLADGWLRNERVHALAFDAALASWREAWWPSSRIAGIPTLDARLVAAERAVTLAALDGVNDDDDAVARALATVAARFAELGPLVIDGLADLAADHGVSLPVAAERRRTDYALAAAGRTAAVPLWEGRSPIDLGRVPAGHVDAAADAQWQVVLEGTEAVVRVSLAAIGDAAKVDLRVTVDGREAPFTRNGGEWVAVVTTPPGRPAEIRVFAPGYDDREPVFADDLIRIARERLARPSSPSEREAAAREQ